MKEELLVQYDIDRQVLDRETLPLCVYFAAHLLFQESNTKIITDA